MDSPKRDFDNMVNALGSQGLHPCHQPVVIENDFVRARAPRHRFFRRRAHRPVAQARRPRSDSSSGPLHQHRVARYAAPDVDGAVSRGARDPEASALCRRHIVRQKSDMIEGTTINSAAVPNGRYDWAP